MIYENGDIYEGDWKNGLEHGKGKIIYQNGDSYDGDWCFGFEDGFGEYVEKSPTGKRYSGDFSHGEFFDRRLTMALGKNKAQAAVQAIIKPEWRCTAIGQHVKHNAGDGVTDADLGLPVKDNSEDGLVAANLINFTVEADDEKSAYEQCQKICQKIDMKICLLVPLEDEPLKDEPLEDTPDDDKPKLRC